MMVAFSPPSEVSKQIWRSTARLRRGFSGRSRKTFVLSTFQTLGAVLLCCFNGF